MQSNSERVKEHDGVLSLLSVTIEGLSIAKEACGVTPARVPLGIVSVLLTMIKVCFILFNYGSRFTFLQESMMNKQDCVELGLSCAKVCEVLIRGLDGRRSDELSPSVHKAIEELTT